MQLGRRQGVSAGHCVLIKGEATKPPSAIERDEMKGKNQKA
jgi:hypothetical protein